MSDRRRNPSAPSLTESAAEPENALELVWVTRAQAPLNGTGFNDDTLIIENVEKKRNFSANIWI